MSDTAPLPAVNAAPGAPPAAKGNGPTPLLYGLGLLAVAVVAGLVWWLVRAAPGGVAGQPVAASPSADPLTEGEFDYTVVEGPVKATDCAANSYDDVANWFTENPCEWVSRGMYTTQVGEARALVSVVLVRMPDATQAQKLKTVTDTNGTGNVNDLARDGTVRLPNAPVVARGEYHSAVKGSELTIVETAFFGGHTDAKLLADISTDAVRLAEVLRG